MDVFAAILRVLVPPIRDFLSYDCAVLSGGSDSNSMGKAVQAGRAAYQAGLCVGPGISDLAAIEEIPDS